jgi:hypothetical protein
MRLSEAEQVFHEEVREKKRIASNVHHKTGKRGYTGKILFPTDFMSRKEKYNHRKAGKIMTTNLYDSILTMNEFEKLETHEKRNMLQYWRTKYSNQEIKSGMGIHNSKYYGLVEELGLPKAPRTNSVKTKRKAAATTVVAKKSLLDFAEEAAEEKTAPPKPIAKEEIQEVMISGISLVFNGTYSPEQIIKQLSKFELLLDGEEDKYYIELKLMQKAESK